MITEFLSPVDVKRIAGDDDPGTNSWGKNITVNNGQLPDLKPFKLAIVGVEEGRESTNNNGCTGGPDYIRKSLYYLNKWSYDLEIIDLGNIKAGNTLKDTRFALRSVLSFLLEQKIIPIIIGGAHHLTYSQFQAFESIGKTVNVTIVDEKINIKDKGKKLDSESFLNRIFLHKPNFLFNYNHLGYQSYFIEPQTLATFERLHFDCYRLGELIKNIEEIEPILRDTDLLSFDISAVRQSDAPANGNASPNGFYAEQVCQVARYAGLSDKLTSIGFYEVNPEYDLNFQTSQLVAQMIWYFVDGFYNRSGDVPEQKQTSDEYTKFIVDLRVENHELIFWKNNRTGRWWMEVPFSESKQEYKRHHWVPCSYADYKEAGNGDIPDRWLNAFKKLV